MKSGTAEHPKTLDFAARLGVNRNEAMGILEGLWHFTAKYAPRGDVGKWPDAQIVLGAYCEHEPARVIRCLIEARWLDECAGEHRLLVHDWPHHAQDAVHMALARAGLYFADGSPPKLTRLSKLERAKALETYGSADRARRGPQPARDVVPADVAANPSPAVLEWALRELQMDERAVRWWHREFVDAVRAGNFRRIPTSAAGWDAALRNSIKRQLERNGRVPASWMADATTPPPRPTGISSEIRRAAAGGRRR